MTELMTFELPSVRKLGLGRWSWVLQQDNDKVNGQKHRELAEKEEMNCFKQAINELWSQMHWKSMWSAEIYYWGKESYKRSRAWTNCKGRVGENIWGKQEAYRCLHETFEDSAKQILRNGCVYYCSSHYFLIIICNYI